LKKQTRDGRLILAFAAVLFLITSAFTNWKGSACYGPRYLLPVLPLVSLPFVGFVDWVRELKNRTLAWLWRGIAFAALAYSFALQIGVNTVPFFFWYDLLKIAEKNNTASNYLDAHFGTVDLDFIEYDLGWSSRFQHRFVGKLDSAEFVRFEGVRMETKWNYYLLAKR
jgi:hypothetical protein